MLLSEKYQAIRKRFFDNYVFQGPVAASIDTTVEGGQVTFGDQTIYMGQALMALATELAVAHGSSQTDAEERINVILQAFEELDLKAETYMDPNAAEELNGFFVRDDITGKDEPRLGGRYKEVASDWQHPELENASPSGDQIFGMMYGLLCVVRYSGNEGLRQRAVANSARLYDYAKRCYFILKLPNGNATRRGSDVRWLASLLHGMNKAITGTDLFSQSKIAVGPFKLPLNGVAAFWADSHTAALIKEHAGEKITIPIIDKEFEINSFALHIMLMALAPGGVWSQSDIEDVALKCNHHLSALWCAQLLGTQPIKINPATVQQILDACPSEGPRASLDASTGWAHDNRWVRCSDIFTPSGGNQQYNGVDWLILYNLNQLVFPHP